MLLFLSLNFVIHIQTEKDESEGEKNDGNPPGNFLTFCKSKIFPDYIGRTRRGVDLQAFVMEFFIPGQ